MLPVIVVAAVFERDGQVLACRRGKGKAGAGLWEFPGGKVEPGETHQEALVREVEEELGVAIDVGELVDRTTTPGSSADIDLATFYVARADTWPRTSTDHDILRWVSATELWSLNWAAPDLPTVARLAPLSGG